MINNMNTSLSARVQRRNAAGFKGEGTKGWVKTTSFGDYKSLEYNNKEKDLEENLAHKSKVGFVAKNYETKNGILVDISKSTRNLTKKYADKHQKVTH